MVEEWDRWRRGYEPAESALIVHGPNSDIDLVNELAQRKRLDAGELGAHAVPAVDRDYLLRPGDVVAMRNAAYTFQAQPGEPRPKRIENGQTAIVESVDPQRDTLTLLLHEPGAQPRLVEIDQARLRKEHACRQARRGRPAELRAAHLPRPRRDRPRHRHPRRPLVPSQARDLRRRHPRDLPPQRPHRPRRPRHRRHRRRPHRPLRAADLHQPPTPRQHPPNPRPHAAARRRPAQAPTAPPRPQRARPARPVARDLAIDARHVTEHRGAGGRQRRVARGVRCQRCVPAAARAGPGAARAGAVGSARASDSRARTTSRRTDRTRAMGARGATAPSAPPPSPHRRAGRATTTLPHRSRPIPTPACFAAGTNAAQRPDDPTLGLPARPRLDTHPALRLAQLHASTNAHTEPSPPDEPYLQAESARSPPERLPCETAPRPRGSCGLPRVRAPT